MPKQHRPQQPPEELPPCDGPKLGLFQHHKSQIQWMERLGDDEDVPAQGYVFRAKVNRREYAIKVFRFFEPMEHAYYWGPIMGRRTPLDEVAYYNDPFYAECRAYGRIQELTRTRRLKKKVVIPCHGFLFLQERDEKILEGRGVDLGPAIDEGNPAYQKDKNARCPMRAVVKDLASNNPGVKQGNLWSLLQGIATLNTHGVYNMDIRLDNYRDGMIVDFGSSVTEPSKLMDAMDNFETTTTKIADRSLFENMLKDEELERPDPKRQPMERHPMKLRPRKKPNS